MFKQLKAWYLKTFLPFEDPSHPLYSDGSIPNCNGNYDNELLQEISDFVEDELDFQDLIGPNYYRQMGDKLTQYEQWGDRWYRKG